MDNVPYLAAHLEKRAGKVESFDIIKRAVKGEELSESDWAVLYSYFLPPKPKKITNPYEWVSMVCDQKESYAFCKYVMIEGGKSIAVNTKTAHILYDDCGLSDGWHDIKKGKAGSDVAVLPNIEQAIKESKGNIFDYKNSVNSFDIVEAPTGLAYVLPWNKKGVDKNYFDLMIKSISDIMIEYSSNGPFRVDGIIKNIKCSAVIMPFKLNGLVAQEKGDQEENNDYEQLGF